MDLEVDMPPEEKPVLAHSLKELYLKKEFCDVVLMCQEERFPCHKMVLAGKSSVFKEGLARYSGSSTASADNLQEVKLVEVSRPEAVRHMLDHMYEVEGEYNPRTPDINTDVLRLAQRFELPGLTGWAAQWLAKDVTSANVVERLAACAEFGLLSLREKLVVQLVDNRAAMQEVVNSPQILTYPELMQALLQQTLALGKKVDEDSTCGPAAKKRLKKGGM